MKIAVLTYWDSLDNYGQILQGYALQQYLRTLGHDAFIVRFHEEKQPESLLKRIMKLQPFYLVKYIKYKKFCKETMSFNKTHTRNFDDFKRNNIVYSNREYWSFNDLLCEDWSGVDAFICGSDQIWSPKYMNNWLAYLLAFVPMRCRKIAYACSFGRTVIDSLYKAQLSKKLPTYDVVGVREYSGVQLCKETGCETAQLVCDPTLLLRSTDYAALIGTKPQTTSTAFVYLLNWEMALPTDEINACLKEKSLQMMFFPTMGTEHLWSSIQDLTISNWLCQIAASQLVITNSFHSTVFAILFHRPFVSLALSGKDAGMNDRLQTLLGELGLQGRIYVEGQSRTIVQIASMPIDWTDVDNRLERLRQSGISLIKDGLNGKNCISCKHRICFYTNGAIHHRYGGLDRVTELLADNFAKQGHEVYYLSITRRETYDKERQHFLPNTQRIDCSENMEAFNAFLRDRNIDVLINQEANVDITLPIANDIRRNIKVLSVLHFNPNYIDDKHFFNKFSRSAGIVNKTLRCVFSINAVNKMGLKFLRRKLARNYRKQLKWSDHLVLLSDRFKDDMLALIGQNTESYKLTAINNPCVISVPVGEQPEKENVILYVGRLDIPFKRVDHILDIWKELSAKHKVWRLQIVGDGADRIELEEKIACEHIERVSMEGLQVPTNYYQRAKFIMLTSSASEGWGMVLTEAQSYGCVPVCYRSYSAIEDIVTDGENGILVNNNDSKELMRKIDEVIASPDRFRAMSERCRESVRKYNIDNISSQWIKLMQ